MIGLLFLYDDVRARAFEPFALTRPASELRAGAELIRARWERALGASATGAIIADHLHDFEELDAPPAATDSIPAGAIVANSRCVVPLEPQPTDAATWMCDGRVAAVRLANDVPIDALEHGAVPLDALARAAGPTVHIAGRWVDEIWHTIRDLNTQLTEDIARLATRITLGRVDHAIHIGRNGVFVEYGATVEPSVCFDASAGPVLVRRGAHIHAFTRVAGPCYIGPDSMVMGDRIGSSAIGEMCKVHGEMSSTIVLGHANKGHDGFVGHSYLGRWVNLGAGTTTSNLKNTYGTVSVWTPGGMRDTGMQFIGTLFGDHAKTGIGMRLTTGSVLGTGANVYGSDMPPRVVPPFAWGDGEPYQLYALEKFVTVAEHVMSRRHVALGSRARKQLARAHAMRWAVSRGTEPR